LRNFREIYVDVLDLINSELIKSGVKNKIQKNVKFSFDNKEEYYEHALNIKKHLEKNGYIVLVYPFTKALVIYI